MKKNFFLYYIFCVLISLNCSYSKNYKNTEDNKDSQDMIINNINILGNTKYDKDFILNISKIKVGDSLDCYNIKIINIVYRLWKSNLFKHVSAYKTNIEDNLVDLFIKIEDFIKIDEICLEEEKHGNIIDIDQFSFLKNKIKLGEVISESNIQDIKNDIKNFYKKKGYNEVVVDSNIINEKNKYVLYLFIKKGKKIEIEEFIFEGNNIINDKELLHLLKKDNSYFLSMIIDKPIMLSLRDHIDQYLKKIKEKYQSLGFVFSEASLVSAWKKKSGNYVVKIKIIEGEKFFLGNVNFIGNEYVKKEDLEKILVYKKGDVYNKIEIKRNIFDPLYYSIFDHYLKLGNIFVYILPIEIRKSNNKIDLKIIIKENLPIYIRNIKISGNNITKDYVIRRELKIHPKELFSIEKMKESMYNIEKLLLFEKVSFKIIPNPNDNKYIDIEWNLKEKNNNDFQINGGFNGYNIKKFYGNLKIVLNNLSVKNMSKWEYWDPIPQGDGDKLIISSKIEKDFKSIGISFIKPWIRINNPTSLKIENNFFVKKLFDNNHPFDENYSINKNDKFLLKKTKTSLELKRDIYVNHDISVITSINKEEFITPNNIDKSKYGKKDFFNFKNIYYLFSIYKNSTKNKVFPFKGSIINLDIKSSLPYFGKNKFYEKNKKEILCNSINSKKNPFSSIKEDNHEEKKYMIMNYFKFKLSGNCYKKMYRDLVMNLGGELGFIGLFNDNKGKYFMKEIPPIHIFRMGGHEKKSENHITLKGYSFPDNYSKYKMSKYGGNVYKKMFLEMRYLINKSYNIKSWITTFIECGNIGNSYKSLISKKMNKSIGFGFRFFWKPIGVFGLDISYPLDYIENTNFSKSKKLKTNFFIGKK